MKTYRLVTESGIGAGAVFDIGAEGASIGRASKNDVHIPDEELSRHHCKLYYLGNALWVTDLATLNGTLVNNTPVEDPVPLSAGDRLQIGSTVLRVEAGDAPDTPASDPGAAPPPPPTAPGDDPIDLGFSGAEPAHAKLPASTRKTLIIAAIGMLAFLLIAIAVKLGLSGAETPPPAMTRIADPEPRSLILNYTKLEGTEQNIFRYELTLDTSGHLSVRIDDLSQGRHVSKKTPEPVADDIRRELARKFERAGFQSMESRYEGIPQANTWNAYTLTAVMGNDAKTVEIRNRVEPGVFRTLREELETFARNELGLWAIEFSRERLIELAIESRLVGQKHFDEREIRLDNLYNAIRNFKSAISYLETIEPKPAFYNDTVNALGAAEVMLDEIFAERNWQADHAINTRNWETAAGVLRELMEIIPDRSDPRNRETERRLLDVESRIQRARR